MGRIVASSSCQLVECFRHPEHIGRLTLADWDLVLRQARQSDLLARLAFEVESQNLLDAVPLPVRNHLQSAQLRAAAQARNVHQEVGIIAAALTPLDCPVVVLKGAAYILQGHPAAHGRYLSDIDIMVPKDRLAEAERLLLFEGWSPAPSHGNAYDQRYYRQWMHELPPLKHARRGTVLDVHHRILPETARLQPDPAAMFAAVQPVPGYANIFVLSDEDMLLHSATHLFHEGEFQHGFRDLLDLQALFADYRARHPDYPERLMERTRQLGLAMPLEYAVNGLAALLNYDCGLPRGQASNRLVEGLYRRALLPMHASCRSLSRSVADFLLYIRSHYLRMPLRLLIPHLLRKAVTPSDKH